jgi:hypothetical protein
LLLKVEFLDHPVDLVFWPPAPEEVFAYPENWLDHEPKAAEEQSYAQEAKLSVGHAKVERCFGDVESRKPRIVCVSKREVHGLKVDRSLVLNPLPRAQNDLLVLNFIVSEAKAAVLPVGHGLVEAPNPVYLVNSVAKLVHL